MIRVSCSCVFVFVFSSRRRHTRCALVTGVQTCALPIDAQDKYAENMLLAVIADAHRLSSLDNQSPVTRLGIASASHLSPWMAEAVAKWRSTVVEYTTASEMGHNEQIDEDELNRLLRSEEHTSELQSLMRISYAVFCL